MQKAEKKNIFLGFFLGGEFYIIFVEVIKNIIKP